MNTAIMIVRRLTRQWSQGPGHRLFLIAISCLPGLCINSIGGRESIDRLFRLDHASRLDQIEAAFGAIDRRLDIEIEGRGEMACGDPAEQPAA